MIDERFYAIVTNLRTLPANWSPSTGGPPGLTTPTRRDSGTQLGYGAEPAIRMEYDDHRNSISAHCARKIRQAMKKEIDEIRRVHGTKYDAAIKEMVDHLPHNKGFQKYLTDYGWKIRTVS
ncbi:hypothetical protein [Streptomyces inhibens]|uniref:hypothetical protein n=1 Tax=Streptomyces inhibens TaxID=2293571 RepID=UPI001EE7287F|nr:hypothetical protein [Streptomyces inhibens]UKY54656.1 hypothetical protein KI385_41575 [Streptomyces inhibens]